MGISFRNIRFHSCVLPVRIKPYQLAVVACRQIPEFCAVGPQAGDPLQGVEREPCFTHVPHPLALDVNVGDDAVSEGEEPDPGLHVHRLDVEEVATFCPASGHVQHRRAESRSVKWFVLKISIRLS
jgi:hypothetical protein